MVRPTPRPLACLASLSMLGAALLLFNLFDLPDDQCLCQESAHYWMGPDLSSLPIAKLAYNRPDRLDYSWRRRSIDDEFAQLQWGCDTGSGADFESGVAANDPHEWIVQWMNPLSHRQHAYDYRGSIDYVNASTGRRSIPDFVHNYRLPEFDTPEIPGDISFAPEVKGVVSIFRRAYVLAKFSFVMDCHTVWFPGGCLDKLHPTDMLGQFDVNSLKSPKIALPGTTVSIGQFNGDKDLFHFFIEDFCRLALVYEYLRDNPSVRVLTYHNPAAVYLFDLIGIKEDRLVWYNATKLFAAERLIVPTATPCGRPMHIATVYMKKVLRQAFLQHYHKGLEPTRVGASRSIVVHQTRNDIENQQELLARLRLEFPEDIISTVSENANIETAINAHYTADLVIGAQGEMMSLCLFARNDAVGVLEFVPYTDGGGRLPRWSDTRTMLLVERTGGVYRGIVSPEGPFIADLDKVTRFVKVLLRNLQNK